jgi:hypothetical protein
MTKKRRSIAKRVRLWTDEGLTPAQIYVRLGGTGGASRLAYIYNLRSEYKKTRKVPRRVLKDPTPTVEVPSAPVESAPSGFWAWVRRVFGYN